MLQVNQYSTGTLLSVVGDFRRWRSQQLPPQANRLPSALLPYNRNQPIQTSNSSGRHAARSV